MNRAAISHTELRKAIIATACKINACGLNQGTSGNVSARVKDGFLITPTGVPYEQLEPQHIVEVGLDGQVAPDQLAPSSEWRFHRDILAMRPEVGAVIHAHSPYATALACARREIPPFHYVVAIAGGATIRCASYATFGTQELSDHILAALEQRRACLMANHGMVAVGPSLEETLRLAQEVEQLARQYHLSLLLGGPVLLSEEEMQSVLRKFETYRSKDCAKKT